MQAFKQTWVECWSRRPSCFLPLVSCLDITESYFQREGVPCPSGVCWIPAAGRQPQIWPSTKSCSQLALKAAPDTIRFLQFNPACCPGGFHQVSSKRYELEYCRQEGIEVNRRNHRRRRPLLGYQPLGWELITTLDYPGVSRRLSSSTPSFRRRRPRPAAPGGSGGLPAAQRHRGPRPQDLRHRRDGTGRRLPLPGHPAHRL